MPAALKLEGQRFGRLVALCQGGRSKHRSILWLCECDCGRLTKVLAAELKNGHTRSCGCREKMRHGFYLHPFYQTWRSMHRRCDPSAYCRDRYFARDIRVCDEWIDVEAFIVYVEEHLGPRPVGYSLDRIDNDGGYEPGNIRWASSRDQALNRSKSPKPEKRHQCRWCEGAFRASNLARHELKCSAAVRVDGRR